MCRRLFWGSEALGLFIVYQKANNRKRSGKRRSERQGGQEGERREAKERLEGEKEGCEIILNPNLTALNQLFKKLQCFENKNIIWHYLKCLALLDRHKKPSGKALF